MWPVGAIIAGWATYGSAYISGNNGWRVPVWIQLVTSGIVAIFAFFLPESVSLFVNVTTSHLLTK
jgi:hypothetical protein